MIPEIEEIHGAAWSPDAKQLVLWEANASVLWMLDLDTPQNAEYLIAHSDSASILGAIWSSNGAFFATWADTTAASDSEVTSTAIQNVEFIIWDADDLSPVQEFRALDGTYARFPPIIDVIWNDLDEPIDFALAPGIYSRYMLGNGEFFPSFTRPHTVSGQENYGMDRNEDGRILFWGEDGTINVHWIPRPSSEAIVLEHEGKLVAAEWLDEYRIGSLYISDSGELVKAVWDLEPEVLEQLAEASVLREPSNTTLQEMVLPTFTPSPVPVTQAPTTWPRISPSPTPTATYNTSPTMESELLGRTPTQR